MKKSLKGTVALGAAAALRSGGTVQVPLVLRNGGTSALRYRLAQTTATGSPALTGQLSFRMDQVSGESNCPTGVDVAAVSGSMATVYTGALTAASSTTSRSLATGATQTLCVRVALPAGHA